MNVAVNTNNNESLRDTIGAAFEEVEQTENGRPDPDTAQPVRTATEDTSQVAPATDANGAIEDRGDGRARNGRFAPKAGDKAAAAAADASGVADPAAAAAAAAGAQPAAPVNDPYARAPQAWKPGAREAWSTLPADVRAEVHRREREAQRITQESAGARQTHEFLGQLSQRYATALQAEGVDVIKATANLMDLSSRLRFGQPGEKALLAAQIIRTYGVDVNALADALDSIGRGQPQGQPHQPQGMYQDPRVDQLFEHITAASAAREAKIAEKAEAEVDKFGEGKEFFEDVREDMADMMELAERRGIDMSMDQAYERCCSLRPEIAKVLDARKAAAAAGNTQVSTQRARNASSSVRGTPSGVSTPATGNLREDIEAAIEQVGGR